MRVGIYCEFYAGNSLGGREFIVAAFAAWLSDQGHDVEFVHHDPSLEISAFVNRFGSETEHFHLRYQATRPPLKVFSASRSRQRQEWAANLSGGYDVFISIVHDAPIRCYAARGLLMVLFPVCLPFDVCADWQRSPSWKPFLLATMHQWRYRIGWERRLTTYQVKTSISEFSRTWTMRRWGFNSEVVFPPVDPPAVAAELATKQNLLLSVGRFSTTGVLKRQLELMETFRMMVKEDDVTWRFACAGGAGDSLREKAYIREVTRLGADVGGETHVNISRAALDRLYGSAKIFWHAAGYGENTARRPEQSEHFGIATVEAMLAGCVPVVINQGAQPEIVEHGVSGFLWGSLSELTGYTRQLINDDGMRETMARAAVQRAQKFTRQAFNTRCAELLEPMLGSGDG